MQIGSTSMVFELLSDMLMTYRQTDRWQNTGIKDPVKGDIK